MKTKICGVPFDLVFFCLINGGIQLCESLYYAVVAGMDLLKNDNQIKFIDILPLVLFLMLALSGVSLMYGGKNVSWIVERVEQINN